MGVRVAVIAVLAACSGGTAHKPHAVDDAPGSASLGSGPGSGSGSGSTGKIGDAQVRVEWKDPPIAARASPGRTACGTAKLAAVAPTVTWGIPDVIVLISAPSSPSPSPTPAPRIVLDHCALSPHVILVPPETSLIVASAADAPAHVSYVKLAAAHPLVIPNAPSAATTIQLPVAGHEVTLAFAPDTLVAITSADDAAIAVIAPASPTAITEANGQVVLRDLPVGTFAVTALLPARAGQDARIAHGTVTVAAGALAEVTLTL